MMIIDHNSDSIFLIPIVYRKVAIVGNGIGYEEVVLDGLHQDPVLVVEGINVVEDCGLAALTLQDKQDYFFRIGQNGCIVY